ncbi:MAG: N-acetyl-gamma-glutamyl-phosphate reductase, partial [Clostridia bacterium]|nr:N-acetyl-gamma-glutamyl-phosphate reductase [Clostridia bacterium]
LNYNPVFSPIVAPYFSGMEVVVPIFEKQLYGSFDNVKELYKRYYKNGLVKYVDCADEKCFLSANALSGKDNMQITVVGHEERMLLIARYDNLGKGASGAAIQNMNIILGVNENTGLSL